jgi:hypothetical protein
MIYTADAISEKDMKPKKVLINKSKSKSLTAKIRGAKTRAFFSQ